ncbi:MAG: hypothetical protein JSR48_00310 [Verrucomicrobia bacterium]|nr:hypothetical protein [Verrucomicrobiota bacterium]
MTLTTTPVRQVRIDPESRPRRRWNPLQLFTDHARAARLWALVAAGAVVTAAVEPYLIIGAYRTRERVVILDGSGTYHVSPLLGFEEAARLHESQALLACLALFQRGPAGFDYPELLEKLFLPEALKQARDQAAAGAEEFSTKALHQKVEVLKVSVLETRENEVLVQAEGQLVRTGLFGGQAFTESPTFSARFTFARNPNLATNGRYPLAVWKFSVSP